MNLFRKISTIIGYSGRFRGILLFSKTPKGDYVLSAGIRRPDDALNPSIITGIDQESYDSWYELGPLKIKQMQSIGIQG